MAPHHPNTEANNVKTNTLYSQLFEKCWLRLQDGVFDQPDLDSSCQTRQVLATAPDVSPVCGKFLISVKCKVMAICLNIPFDNLQKVLYCMYVVLQYSWILY